MEKPALHCCVCGGNPELVILPDGVKVSCSKKGCKNSTGKCRTPESAIRAWARKNIVRTLELRPTDHDWRKGNMAISVCGKCGVLKTERNQMKRCRQKPKTVI